MKCKKNSTGPQLRQTHTILEISNKNNTTKTRRRVDLNYVNPINMRNTGLNDHALQKLRYIS